VTFVVLLRGVNLGGHKMLAMADLRAALTRMGFSGVTTVLQSGNVVFQGAAIKTSSLETRVEKEIEKRLGLKADVHVRTAAEWLDVVAANPFTAEAKRDPGHLLVTFFRAPLDTSRVDALNAAITGPEIARADGRHLYMVFPDGIGNSKAAPLVEKLLGARGTARNWNTVTKLAALAGSARR
jgi:uncharacterized protein (DUF1697 family)